MTMAISESAANKSSETGDQQTVTIPVLGMSCAACQSHVEHALRQTPGVDGAEVNLMTHTARVVFDPLVASPESLVQAVKNSGYESSLPEKRDQGEHHMHDHIALSDPAQIRFRALTALPLAAAAMLLSMPLMEGMGAHPGLLSWLPMTLAPGSYRIPAQPLEFALLALTLVGMWLAGGEVYKPAWKALLHRTTNMNTLVALGTIAALLYSAVATLAPQILSLGTSPRGLLRVGALHPRLPDVGPVARGTR